MQAYGKYNLTDLLRLRYNGQPMTTLRIRKSTCVDSTKRGLDCKKIPYKTKLNVKSVVLDLRTSKQPISNTGRTGETLMLFMINNTKIYISASFLKKKSMKSFEYCPPVTGKTGES